MRDPKKYCVKRAFENMRRVSNNHNSSNNIRLVYDRDKPKTPLGIVAEKEWNAAKLNEPVTLYDLDNNIIGKVPRTTQESREDNIRYHLNRMEAEGRKDRITREEYQKTLKLLDLTNRHKNEKEGED